MKTIIMLLLLILCFACQSKDANAPSQAQESAKIVKDCQYGCENLSDIKCLGEKSVVSCVNSCVKMMNETQDKDPKCWAALISCDELEACRK